MMEKVSSMKKSDKSYEVILEKLQHLEKQVRRSALSVNFS